MVVPVIAALSSSLFWWWYTISSNLRDLNPIDIQSFPLPESALDDEALAALGRRYLEDIDRHSVMATRRQKSTGETQTQSFKIAYSKPILDEVDRTLGRHYGLNDQEIDFVINYDLRYRLSDAQDE